MMSFPSSSSSSSSSSSEQNPNWLKAVFADRSFITNTQIALAMPDPPSPIPFCTSPAHPPSYSEKEPPPHINYPLIRSLISISGPALESSDHARLIGLKEARQRYYAAHEIFNAAYRALADEVGALNVQEAVLEGLERELREVWGKKEEQEGVEDGDDSFGFDFEFEFDELLLGQELQQPLATSLETCIDNHILAHERELRQAMDLSRASPLPSPCLFFPFSVTTNHSIAELETQCSHTRFLIEESHRHLEHRTGVLTIAGQKREETSVWFSGVKMAFLREEIARLVFVARHVYQRARVEAGHKKGDKEGLYGSVGSVVKSSRNGRGHLNG